MLRYVLSEKGDREKIIENMKKGLEWRRKNMEVLRYLRLRSDGGNYEIHTDAATVPEAVLHVQQVTKIIFDHLTVGLINFKPNDVLSKEEETENRAELRFPLMVVRAMFNRPKTLLKKIKREDMVNHFSYQNEMMYRLIDGETRRTGRWVKLLSAVDATGFTLFNKELDLKFFRIMGESSKRSVFLHPQLVGGHAAVNFPSSMVSLMKFVKKLFSKRIVQKQGVCLGGPIHKRNDAAETCPFVKRHNLGNVLPPFLGGRAECPAFMDLDKKQKPAVETSSTATTDTKTVGESTQSEQPEQADLAILTELQATLDD